MDDVYPQYPQRFRGNRNASALPTMITLTSSLISGWSDTGIAPPGSSITSTSRNLAGPDHATIDSPFSRG